MERLAVTTSQMNRPGCFRDNTNCLSHLDLAANNITVEVHLDNTITVTGVLDVDSACLAPTFVSCYLPWWLWEDETQPGDALEDETQSKRPPPDPELLEIKRIFEEIIGDNLLRYAYHPDFRLARRLFKIACHGHGSSDRWEKTENSLEEWDAFDKAVVEDYHSGDEEKFLSSAGEDFHVTQEQKGSPNDDNS